MTRAIGGYKLCWVPWGRVAPRGSNTIEDFKVFSSTEAVIPTAKIRCQEKSTLSLSIEKGYLVFHLEQLETGT